MTLLYCSVLEADPEEDEEPEGDDNDNDGQNPDSSEDDGG